MLTEIDSRDTPSGEVSLWMDTDAQVYLVAVEGYAPFPCLTRDRALMAYRHPFVYMPLEGSVSPPKGTEGDSPSQQPFLGITEDTASVFVQLRDILYALDECDFRWTVSILGDIVQEISRFRGCNRPYNQDEGEIAF